MYPFYLVCILCNQVWAKLHSRSDFSADWARGPVRNYLVGTDLQSLEEVFLQKRY